MGSSCSKRDDCGRVYDNELIKHVDEYLKSKYDPDKKTMTLSVYENRYFYEYIKHSPLGTQALLHRFTLVAELVKKFNRKYITVIEPQIDEKDGIPSGVTFYFDTTNIDELRGVVNRGITISFQSTKSYQSKEVEGQLHHSDQVEESCS